MEKVIINYSVLTETRDKIMAISEKTYRSQGNVVDLAIDELYKNLFPSEVKDSQENVVISQPSLL